jgi:hypothetical protein
LCKCHACWMPFPISILKVFLIFIYCTIAFCLVKHTFFTSLLRVGNRLICQVFELVKGALHFIGSELLASYGRQITTLCYTTVYALNSFDEYSLICVCGTDLGLWGLVVAVYVWWLVDKTYSLHSIEWIVVCILWGTREEMPLVQTADGRNLVLGAKPWLPYNWNSLHSKCYLNWGYSFLTYKS